MNLDASLSACLSKLDKSKKGAPINQEPIQFLRRDEVAKEVIGKMQSWYEIRVPGSKNVVTKCVTPIFPPMQALMTLCCNFCRKGRLSPIEVVTKIRQGRKACTLITGFEPFLVIEAEDMAEELKRICAGATAGVPLFHVQTF